MIGALVYRVTFQWIYAVAGPVIAFVVTTLMDVVAQDAWLFTLYFGVPIVFFGSLLGSYVVQIRTHELEDNQPSNHE